MITGNVTSTVPLAFGFRENSSLQKGLEKEASGWLSWLIPSLIQSLGPGWGGGFWQAAVCEVAKSWTENAHMHAG